jgi:hypothetical protein
MVALSSFSESQSFAIISEAEPAAILDMAVFLNPFKVKRSPPQIARETPMINATTVNIRVRRDLLVLVFDIMDDSCQIQRVVI